MNVAMIIMLPGAEVYFIMEIFDHLIWGTEDESTAY